jgi:hypothetical protein
VIDLIESRVNVPREVVQALVGPRGSLHKESVALALSRFVRRM